MLKDVPDDSRSRQYLVLIEVKRKAAEERKKPTPQKVLLLYEAALRDYGAGELAKAQDKLAEALHIAGKLGDKPKPLVSRVRLLLGRIHYDKGGLDSAKTHCRAGLDILSGMKTEGIEFQLGELHYWLGVTLAKQAEEESALTRFRKAFPYLRKAAKSSRSAVEAADLLVHSARANTALGQFDEALSDYISAVEILPQYPNVHYLTAQTAQRAGKMPQAARFYTLSMKKGEKVTESSYEMGKLLFEAGKHTDAITSLLAALEKTTEPYYLAACNYYLGHAFYEIELFDEAADAWREYLKHEKDPDKRELVIKRIETDPRLKGK